MKKFLMAVVPGGLAILFAILWLGQCWSPDKGDGMSNETRERLTRLSADSARFYRDQAARDSANRVREAANDAALKDVERLDSVNAVLRAGRQRFKDSVATLEAKLYTDVNAPDSVRTLLELRIQDKLTITSLNKEVINLQVAKDTLTTVIVRKDSTIAADSVSKAESKVRMADLELGITNLRTDLAKALECEAHIGPIPLGKCPSRKVVAAVSYVLGAATIGVLAYNAGKAKE